jgi:hypothetical protein
MELEIVSYWISTIDKRFDLLMHKLIFYGFMIERHFFFFTGLMNEEIFIRHFDFAPKYTILYIQRVMNFA